MRKELIYLSFLILLFSSCEERYNPAIDIVDGQLVIEAQITNDMSKSFVHLTKTRDFYSKQQPEEVSGAKVELVEINGNVVQGTESSSGYFNFSTVPEVGKNYKLRVTVEKDIYESEVVTMPPLPTLLKSYTEEFIKKTYSTDGDGTIHALDTPGRAIYVDAPISESLSHYRFFTRSILQWIYTPPNVGIPPPATYGWQSYYDYASFNLAAPKEFSKADLIEKHSLLWLSYNSQDYLSSNSLIALGWILIVDQFGTSKGSFDYHEKLNSQFAADGNLFDPIQTQIYGNITCITDPSKIVFGYFDLNSYQQYRYYTNLNAAPNDITLRQIFQFPDIPDNGQIVGGTPDWWER